MGGTAGAAGLRRPHEHRGKKGVDTKLRQDHDDSAIDRYLLLPLFEVEHAFIHVVVPSNGLALLVLPLSGLSRSR